jgi:hypothetical protein
METGQVIRIRHMGRCYLGHAAKVTQTTAHIKFYTDSPTRKRTLIIRKNLIVPASPGALATGIHYTYTMGTWSELAKG